MPSALHDLRVCRADGTPPPAGSQSEQQLQSLSREVSDYVTGGSGALTPDGLASFLQANWPDSTVVATTEYYTYIDPVTGQRVTICIDHQVAVTKQQTASGVVVVNPTLMVCFEMDMAVT